MVERFIAPVLKTGDPQGSVGSNPTPSARLIINDLRRKVHPHRNASAFFHYRFYWDYSANWESSRAAVWGFDSLNDLRILSAMGDSRSNSVSNHVPTVPRVSGPRSW
jgi:hypothetical protein